MRCVRLAVSLRAMTAALAVLGLELALALPAAGGAPTCVGDCAGDGEVTIVDLISGVNIALGSAPVSACPAMDSSGNGEVSVDELIRAVTAALDGCPALATATATASSPPQTPSPTAADTPTATAAETATAPPTTTATEAAATATPTPIPTLPEHFCDLPGSVQSTAPGLSVVPGGPAATADLTFLHLPVGFCAHFFANVGNTRRLRFAPGGELFVASPTKFTTSNGPAGRAAIVILPDDDRDGTADQAITFLGNLPATAGLLFTNGSLYYQNDTKIMRTPYAPGDRAPSGDSEQVANITVYTSLLHWPKPLDVADDGTIYVGNGGDEGERTNPNPPPDPCEAGAHPFHGGILKLDGSPGGAQVAQGFRNPISVRCLPGHNTCFAVELARDFSYNQNGREKLVPIRQGDDWGFPCCATKDEPYTEVRPDADCSGIASEIGSFYIGHTPFDVDYELGKWPEPWGNRAYLPLHGTYGEWKGARVVGISIDAMTGEVLPGSDLPGMSPGAMEDFATGWDDGRRAHGRPAVVAFAPDGRLFLGNDTNGDIIWIAPLSLPIEPAAAQP